MAGFVVALLFALALAVLSTPAAARGRPITLVEHVVASQFDSGVFVALVGAAGGTDSDGAVAVQRAPELVQPGEVLGVVRVRAS